MLRKPNLKKKKNHKIQFYSKWHSLNSHNKCQLFVSIKKLMCLSLREKCLY